MFVHVAGLSPLRGSNKLLKVSANTSNSAQDIRKQLLGIMDRHKLDVVSCGKSVSKVQKTVTSGFFRNTARKVHDRGRQKLANYSPATYIIQWNPA